VITAALFLRMMQRMFLGPLPDRWTGWTDLGTAEMVALVPVLAFVVIIGVAPAWLIEVIDSVSRVLVGG
jgi:NADH-quinone oxidoreductase subunit M